MKQIALTEEEFQQQVIDLAKIYHWKVYHTWGAFHSARGFPDMVLVKGDRLVFAEIKGERGKLSNAQREWLVALKETGRCEVFTWRPSNWEEIVSILSMR